MKKGKPKPVILAYGFDSAGFLTPTSDIEDDKSTIRFLDFGTETSLEEGDGIIMPSGIFEKFESASSYGSTSKWVTYDKDFLARRQKELSHHLSHGGWVAFLLRSVDVSSNKWSNSDLAKRVLNCFFSEIEAHDPATHNDCKADEFKDYFHHYGINRTSFRSPKKNVNPRKLAGGENWFTAAEIDGKVFFLPLPAIAKGHKEVVGLAKRCANGILEYKRRNDFYLPKWVESIEFKTEKKIAEEIQALEEKTAQAHQHLAQWGRYKGVLSASGRPLNVLVVEILRDFFGLNLKSKEDYIEDALIYDSEGAPLFVVEIKGINAGLKRDHVNQVDSHRERLGISADIPGLLILNDFSDIDGVAERQSKSFDSLHIAHAEKLNIKILRTTVLIQLIQLFEENPTRGGLFLELCNQANPLVALPPS